MKFSTMIALLMCIVLTGCVATVIAVGAAGTIVYDRRSLSTLEKDTRIFYLVNKAIVTEPRFRGSHITVVSFNQMVLLAGETPTNTVRAEIDRIAHQQPNVYRVYNEISIKPSTTLAQRGKDSWITGQIRALLLTKKGLESGSIRILTEDSTVYLLGIATHEQADTAVHIARQVAGVTKVVKVFRYIS